MWNQPHTVKPFLSVHCNPRPTFSQPCLIRPMQFEASLISQTCLICPLECDANLMLSNLSDQTTGMWCQPHIAKPVWSDHWNVMRTSCSQTCLIRPLECDANLMQSNLPYQTNAIWGQPHKSNLSDQTTGMWCEPHTVKPVLSDDWNVMSTSYSQTCLIRPLECDVNLRQANLSDQTTGMWGQHNSQPDYFNHDQVPLYLGTVLTPLL